MRVLRAPVVITFLVLWTVCSAKPLKEDPKKLIKDITITIHSEETNRKVNNGPTPRPKQEKTTPRGDGCSYRLEALPSIQIYLNGDCLYEDMILDEGMCRSIIGPSVYKCLVARMHFIKAVGP